MAPDIDDAKFGSRRRDRDVRVRIRQITLTQEIAEEHLRTQSIPELKASIHRIDKMIASFEVMKGEALSLAESEDRVAIVMYLRDLRHIALEQIGEQVSQKQVDELNRAVEAKVDDPKVRQELGALVAEFAQKQQDLARELQAHDDEDAKELRRHELSERKWKMRTSLLEREPAAVLIGAVLLAAMALALIVGMFIHTPPPDLLGNAFLLILGFFFGQTTSGRARRADDRSD
ncbi:hypothetical protein IRT45_32405 [Nocardia sp. BSTN01]|uniref:hypothetical protein n=1 Tax=Nocardia sp. BSTN01 TaxID=2783665 RepID=UPI00188E978A|nr:hypothetical protein [Nocardia sp. BSTN01]MBF5001832.1 hypothetical protein [Nocardia sp. BSTN01]